MFYEWHCILQYAKTHAMCAFARAYTDKCMSEFSPAAPAHALERGHVPAVLREQDVRSLPQSR
jgi:hypothetical protein